MKRYNSVHHISIIRLIFSLAIMVMVFPVQALAAGEKVINQVTKTVIDRRLSTDTRQVKLESDLIDIGDKTGITSTPSLPFLYPYGNPAGCAPVRPSSYPLHEFIPSHQFIFPIH